MSRQCSIYVGYEPREEEAYAVAVHSIQRRLTTSIPVRGLRLRELERDGLYTRPTVRKGKNLWDVISDAPMSTEFSISRFLVPTLAGTGLALFVDGDILVRADLSSLFATCTGDYPVWCVHHAYNPHETIKKDGQAQTQYNRKNWSSVMVFDCDHPANKALTPELVNTLPGRDLHAFCWLNGSDIGKLHEKWNWLAGHSSPNIIPSIVHMTTGGPWFPECVTVPYAGVWQQERAHMLRHLNTGVV